MAETKNKSKNITAYIVAGAVAATAAGYYWLYASPKAKARLKAIRGWMLKAKGEVMEKMEGVKNLNREKFDGIVDSVVERYRRVANVTKEELEDFRSELADTWGQIEKVSKAGVKKAKRKAKNAGEAMK